MKLGLCLQVFYDRSLESALATAKELGVDMVELAVDRNSPLLDLDEALKDHGRTIKQLCQKYDIQISALSNHQEGILLLTVYFYLILFQNFLNQLFSLYHQ